MWERKKLFENTKKIIHVLRTAQVEIDKTKENP